MSKPNPSAADLKIEFTRLFERLAKATGAPHRVEPVTIDVYWESFGECTPQVWAQICKRAVLDCDEFPSVKKLREIWAAIEPTRHSGETQDSRLNDFQECMAQIEALPESVRAVILEDAEKLAEETAQNAWGMIALGLATPEKLRRMTHRSAVAECFRRRILDNTVYGAANSAKNRF